MLAQTSREDEHSRALHLPRRWYAVSCERHAVRARPFCLDDRQYLRPGGQRWTALTTLRAGERYTNSREAIAPRVTGIVTQLRFASGQPAHPIQTPHGNILWDCISDLDAAIITAVREHGGVTAITFSRPHVFSSDGLERGPRRRADLPPCGL